MNFTKRVVLLALSIFHGQAFGETPFSTLISVFPASDVASLVTNTDSVCKQENTLFTGSCTKTTFSPAVQIIGDAASCIQFSGPGVDLANWNVTYEINLPTISSLSYSRYIYFTFNQACASNPNSNYYNGIDIDVLTSDGIWESNRTNANSPGYSNSNKYWPWSSLYLPDHGP